MTAAFQTELERCLGARAVSVTPVSGGCICDAYRVELAGGQLVFVKSRPSGLRPVDAAALFRAEAAGLAWLATAEALRVPYVVAVSDEMLALEWVEPGEPEAVTAARLGHGLAALHRSGAPTFGWDRDGFVGSLPQPNAPAPTWAEFYVDRRIAPLAKQCCDRGLLPPSAVSDLDMVCARMAEVAGPPEPPARLHGDLWSGNVLVAVGGEPVLIDPAPYGGHREVDLAMMRLFGGFDASCFAAYEEAFPLADGAADRVALYQLYPLLVHTLLFGGAYAGSVARVAREVKRL
jgi:fructosamine-3-kinase